MSAIVKDKQDLTKAERYKIIADLMEVLHGISHSQALYLLDQAKQWLGHVSAPDPTWYQRTVAELRAFSDVQA